MSLLVYADGKVYLHKLHKEEGVDMFEQKQKVLWEVDSIDEKGTEKKKTFQSKEDALAHIRIVLNYGSTNARIHQVTKPNSE